MITIAVNTTLGSLYMQTGVTIEGLVKTISEIPNSNVDNFTTKLFTDLLKLDGGTHLIVGGMNGALVNAKKYLVIMYNNGVNNVQYYNSVVFGRVGTTTFNGSFNSFKESINPISKFTNLKEKLLRFKYTGGTTTGVRIIRLEEATAKGGDILLKGVDMAHALDPKASSKDKGYRSYLVSKIDGQIDVLN